MAETNERGTGVREMADLTVPMALRAAATLRIADHIHRGAHTADELATATGTRAPELDRLLRHLVTAGVLDRDEAGGYALTARGQELRDDDPRGVRARLDIEGMVGRAELSFVEILHTVRTGGLAYTRHYGRPFWEDLAADPALYASFEQVMSFNLRQAVPAILAARDWASLARVVDVGGGDGTLLNALLTRHPGLRGTLVELPSPAAAAREAATAAGLAERIEVVVGSFFDPLPPGAGGYLLSDILHNWDDDDAVAILRRCADAAGPDGAVFVIERLGEDAYSPSTEMDMRMLAYFGGRQRDLGELAGLAAQAGLKVAAVHPTADVSVVEMTAR
jgi:hypothetical protein